MCLQPRDIARAVTTGDVPGHAEECVECRRKLDAQRALGRALQALPMPRLDDARRRAIKAETMAVVGRRVPHASAWRWSFAAAGLAAGALLVVGLERAPSATVEAPSVVASELVTPGDRYAAHDDVPPPPRAPTIAVGEDSVLSQTPGEQRDGIAFADGTLEIDTRGTRDVDARVGRTVVHVDDARVRIRARHHTIVSVEVVVGSARIDGPGQQVTLERHTLWTPEPPAATTALSVFRDAWVALRAGRDREAVTLFDRATDSSVVEEATYWAAVASLRAGDDAEARLRFAAFLEQFPSSPYAGKARAALAQ